MKKIIAVCLSVLLPALCCAEEQDRVLINTNPLTITCQCPREDCQCESIERRLLIDDAWIKAHSPEEVAMVLSFINLCATTLNNGAGFAGAYVVCCSLIEKLEGTDTTYSVIDHNDVLLLPGFGDFLNK